MEESPYILMNPEQNEPTKSGHQHQKEDCADGIRAWHWYHFENCAECGRLLQGKESVLETWTIRGLQIHLGKVLVIIQLPDTLPNCELGPSEGGVGYTRLFIQKMAFSLNLEYVFVIDDNVAVMYEAVFNTGDTTATEGRVLRDENGVMKMQRCSFLKPLTRLQKIAQGKDIPPIDERKYEPHPLKDEFESQEFPLYSYTGPAKLFVDKQHESYGVLGLLRSVPIAVNPFSKTQVYAAILLNVKSTVEKGSSTDHGPAGKTYASMTTAIKQIFEWKDDSVLEERLLVSELPKDLEESVILEHLRNFVNIQGSEKCFKGSIGCDREEAREDIISPTIIVEQLEQVETRDCMEEGSPNEVPVLILSYYETIENLVLLDKTFCSTKEKIVFVTSAREAIKWWPRMMLGTISTSSGICISPTMRDQNAQFAIFSAADPKRHSLRWILIEASFLPPQDNKDDREENITTRDEHVFQDRNEPKVEESTSSDHVQGISNGKKGAKRSFQESLDDYNEIKRPKYEDYCSQRLEDVLPGTSDDVNKKEERGSQETSQGGTTKVFGNSKLKRKRPEAVTSEFEYSNKEISYTGIRSVGSASDDKAIASEKMPDISGSDEEGDADVEDGCDVSIVSENQETPGRKRDGRNDSFYLHRGKQRCHQRYRRSLEGIQGHQYEKGKERKQQ
ncbi:hypothetical protein OS493_004644 [Desmophyllum pertusum]|uniref:Uncharacterized protein n=1 Tax=Desmophyllum pertusum TaxID=174260 RepID=A0A9W9ZG04_9CNID|nr:hypothetical protein OS493_004644 [Desmophyllum pertusum]